MPLAPELIGLLRQSRSKAAYAADADWVFASEFMDGKQPLWPDSLLKRFVQPTAITARITKRIGWHMLRHTYSTLLRANGTDIKVQQELLRHSNAIYTIPVSQCGFPTQGSRNSEANGTSR